MADVDTWWANLKVLHGHAAVAALKRPALPGDADPRLLVLHGHAAVAALKHGRRGYLVGEPQGSPRPCCRGRIEAASTTGRRRPASTCSPRPCCRGRIEAWPTWILGGRTSRFSTAMLPWPH